MSIRGTNIETLLPSQALFSAEAEAFAIQKEQFGILPIDIITSILSRSSLGEVSSFGRTCKKFYVMTFYNNDLWRLLFLNRFSITAPKENCLEKYKNQHFVYKNLTNGAFVLLKSMSEDEICFIDSVDGKMLSKTKDKIIKIWDLKTGECLNTLSRHQGAVCCLGILDGKIISGSEDQTIKIWDLKTGECLNTLSGHQGAVCCLGILDGKIISGSGDQTIKIWDLKTGECLNTLSGHQGAVYCLGILDGKIISGSFDQTIKIWDLKIGECLNTLSGHQHRIYCLSIGDGKIVSGSFDQTIKIWDLKTGRCLNTLKQKGGAVLSLCIADGKILAGLSGLKEEATRITIWDLKTGVWLNTLHSGSKWGVRFLDIQDGKLVLSTGDESRIWDFNVDTILEKIVIDIVNIPMVAIEEFLKLPDFVKNKIYGELSNILNSNNFHNFEEAFEGLLNEGFSKIFNSEIYYHSTCVEKQFVTFLNYEISTFQQIALAIRNYLINKHSSSF